MTFVTFVLFKVSAHHLMFIFIPTNFFRIKVPKTMSKRFPKTLRIFPVSQLSFGCYCLHLVYLLKAFSLHLKDDPNMFEDVWRYQSLSEYTDILRPHYVNGEIKKTA